MRNDFDKVLTEDPRRGSRAKFRQVRRSKKNASFDGEFSGGKESMMTQRRNQQKQNRKTFGDHLNPLRKFIASQVGKRWNDVYSEICAKFDQRAQLKFHVHQHVFDDFVELNTRLIDGKVCLLNRWDGWKEVGTSYSRQDFYVHPVTGALCTSYKENEPGYAAKEAAAKLARQQAVFREHSKDEHLYLENGIWMLYRLADRPAPHIEYRCPIWWTTLERLRWEKMTLAEREREGSPVWVRTPVLEVKAPTVSYGGRYWQTRDMAPTNRYYVSRQVAGRKYLRAHGLVGTATGVPAKAMSHREASKYR
jgi:hypothetical protein